MSQAPEDKTIKWTEPYYPPFEDIKREMIKDTGKAVMGFLKMISSTAVVLGVIGLHVWFFAEYLGMGEDNGVPLGLVTAFGLWVGIPGGLWLWYGSIIERLQSQNMVDNLRTKHEADCARL